ncbi:MAG: hypothetical protein K0S04_3058 [Herbinix sp.]|nr:hypothetical protein [Herbinix sp.]
MKKRVLSVFMILFMLTAIVANQNAIITKADTKDGDSVLLEEPPFSYFLAHGKVNNKKAAALKLKVKSSKTNSITDEENWLKKNKLSLNTYEVPNSYRMLSGNLPEEIDTKWNGLIITSAFYDKSYIYCIYGSDFSEGYILNIYDYNTLKILYSLDFTNYKYSPKYIKSDYEYIQQRVNWAAIKDDILYVSHSHNTYAKSSNNMNAYITAIDLSDMSIIWRTKALVSNSNNFVIVDNVILCGYGFTDEKDYLYQINRNNGVTISKTSLKSAASYLVKKGNSLYVRTYNTDYILELGK